MQIESYYVIHNIVIKLVKLILDLDQYILYNYTIHLREYFFTVKYK